MKVQLSELRPNPFRNLKRLPLDKERVKALKRSIDETSFWENLIGRKANGSVEIAYGHHRVQALKELGYDEVDIRIGNYTDTDMVKIMSHENMGEWQHNAEFEVEVVRATLEAAESGQIDLPPVPRDTAKDCLRSVAATDRYYTADSLAKFLGWKPYKVESALNFLDAETEETIDRDTIHGLKSTQAREVVRQVKRLSKIATKARAKAIGRTLAAGMKKASGDEHEGAPFEVTMKTAREVADRLVGKVPAALRDKRIPNINQFAKSLTSFLSKVFTTRNIEKLSAIVKHVEHLDAERKRELRKELEKIAKQATKFAEELA